MGGFEFRDPFFLVFGLLAPLVYVLASGSPSAVRYSSLTLLGNAPSSWRVKLLPLPAICLALATLALAVALAGPRTGDASSKIHREGIAMMLVVDRSGSMNARDFVRGDQSVDRLVHLAPLGEDEAEATKRRHIVRVEFQRTPEGDLRLCGRSPGSIDPTGDDMPTHKIGQSVEPVGQQLQRWADIAGAPEGVG